MKEAAAYQAKMEQEAGEGGDADDRIEEERKIGQKVTHSAAASSVSAMVDNEEESVGVHDDEEENDENAEVDNSKRVKRKSLD